MEKQMNFEKIEQKALVQNRIKKTGTYLGLTIWAVLVLFPFYYNCSYSILV